MNHKEFLILSIGIFLTIIAWMTIDIYQVQNKHSIEKQIKPVGIVSYQANDRIFEILKEKKP